MNRSIVRAGISCAVLMCACATPDSSADPGGSTPEPNYDESLVPDYTLPDRRCRTRPVLESEVLGYDYHWNPISNVGPLDATTR